MFLKWEGYNTALIIKPSSAIHNTASINELVLKYQADRIFNV